MQLHIRETPRAALNVVIAQQVMPALNAAAQVELVPGAQPQVLVCKPVDFDTLSVSHLNRLRTGVHRQGFTSA
ncbi:hypothetical protein [Streptomyces sp. NPDC048361]|uniref:hypothetical protein n=1 Tax=Streptomyces sp. NPDC048361 TaxID=3154720 RepID=UPI003416E5B5